MNDRIDELANELEQVARSVRASFGSLSRDRLNWKPSADGWSIAQCLDHLITINALYFPLLASFRAGPVKPTFWERHSPLSGFLGKLLIRTLSPEYPKKTKTSPKAEPSSSEIDPGILNRFADHQAELIGHMRQIPTSIDRGKAIVTSPLLGWVTYSLDDCLTILVVHENDIYSRPSASWKPRHFRVECRVSVSRFRACRDGACRSGKGIGRGRRSVTESRFRAFL